VCGYARYRLVERHKGVHSIMVQPYLADPDTMQWYFDNLWVT
jgi:hypothetical protein